MIVLYPDFGTAHRERVLIWRSGDLGRQMQC